MRGDDMMTKRIWKTCRPQPGESPPTSNLDCTLVSLSQGLPLKMPPRLNLFSANKALLAVRQPTIPAVASRNIALPLRFRAEQSTPAQKRWNSSKKEPNPDEQVFPTQDQLPHVSEEAAEIDRIMNKEKSCDGQPSSPELDQGTPVVEVSRAIMLFL